MSAPARTRADAELPTPTARPHRAVLGSPSNFWLHSTRHGFDLTHPATPTSPPITPALRLSTTTTPITIDPAKTALMIIDMQNFFLSPAVGRAPAGPGHKACDALLTHAIPAARKAGIQIVWLNWGLTDEDVANMPPATIRAFGFETVPEAEEEKEEEDTGTGIANGKEELPDEIAQVRRPQDKSRPNTNTNTNTNTTTENGKDKRIYKGLGSDMGRITLHSTLHPTSTATSSPTNGATPQTKTIEAGRLLMRDTWNASLYAPLHTSYKSSLSTPKPDVWIHKNRMSGLWGAATPCTEYLESRGLRTLLFAGVNTDQCVAGSVQDAFTKGWDCVLLSDACGTSSPGFATSCVEFNCAKSWGFVVGCGELGRGVEEMVGERVEGRR